MIDRLMLNREQVGYLSRIIAEIRVDHPTLSCRAIYYKICPEHLGRDAFERLCKELGYTVSRKVNKHRTTDSTGVVRFDNLLAGLSLVKVNQAWSSDITYFEVGGVFYYITFVMDCYSRKILGYSVSQRLMTEQTTMPALQMAVINRGRTIPKGIVFHSDGGGQYFDKVFLKYTQKLKMKNSMCEYAYENGKAERLNGIIKNNYLRHYTIKNFEQLSKSVDLCVSLYNNERPHKNLKYATPVEFEKQLVLLQKQTKLKMTESLDANDCL